MLPAWYSVAVTYWVFVQRRAWRRRKVVFLAFVAVCLRTFFSDSEKVLQMMAWTGQWEEEEWVLEG